MREPPPYTDAEFEVVEPARQRLPAPTRRTRPTWWQAFNQAIRVDLAPGELWGVVTGRNIPPDLMDRERGRVEIHWPFGGLSKAYFALIVFAIILTAYMNRGAPAAEATHPPPSADTVWRSRLDRLPEPARALIREGKVLAVPGVGEGPDDPVHLIPIDPPGPSYSVPLTGRSAEQTGPIPRP